MCSTYLSRDQSVWPGSAKFHFRGHLGRFCRVKIPTIWYIHTVLQIVGGGTYSLSMLLWQHDGADSIHMYIDTMIWEGHYAHSTSIHMYVHTTNGHLQVQQTKFTGKIHNVHTHRERSANHQSLLCRCNHTAFATLLNRLHQYRIHISTTYCT